MPHFTGFPSEGLAFLATLGTKDKAWFDDHRSTYEDHVVAPVKAFVASLGDWLAAEVSPTITAVPRTNGSIAPINNDLRFNPDRSPYKDHLLLRFWDGEQKRLAPTLWVRVSPEGTGFATGAALPDLDRWRSRIADERTGRPFEEALAALQKGRDLDVVGQDYKRVPSPYDEDHPRADLLRHKSFQARWSEPNPKTIDRASYVAWCGRRLAAAAPLHHWFTTNL